MNKKVMTVLEMLCNQGVLAGFTGTTRSGVTELELKSDDDAAILRMSKGNQTLDGIPFNEDALHALIVKRFKNDVEEQPAS